MKKAQIAEKTIYYILFGVIFTAIFFILIHLISTYFSISNTTPPGLQEKIFIQRFLSSPYCFVYTDGDIGRSYPGTIDLSRFTKENLDYCYESFDSKEQKSSLTSFFTAEDATRVSTSLSIVSRQIPFRLTLSVLDPSMQMQIQTNGWNNETKEVFVKDVLVKLNSEIKRGKLKFEVGKFE